MQAQPRAEAFGWAAQSVTKLVSAPAGYSPAWLVDPPQPAAKTSAASPATVTGVFTRRFSSRCRTSGRVPPMFLEERTDRLAVDPEADHARAVVDLLDRVGRDDPAGDPLLRALPPEGEAGREQQDQGPAVGDPEAEADPARIAVAAEPFLGIDPLRSHAHQHPCRDCAAQQRPECGARERGEAE